MTSPAMFIKVAQYMKIYRNWLVSFTENCCLVHVLKNKSQSKFTCKAVTHN